MSMVEIKPCEIDHKKDRPKYGDLIVLGVSKFNKKYWNCVWKIDRRRKISFFVVSDDIPSQSEMYDLLINLIDRE